MSMMSKAKKFLPSWRGWVAIAVGVIILRKLEISFPALATYTRTDWPIGYFRK